MNPYQVLGVSENATDDEIRRAYRELVKKYHPDQYRDNPLSELAQEKLKEINEAYDMLMKRSSRSSSYSSGSSYSSSGSSTSYADSSSYSSYDNSALQRARSLLNANNPQAAYQELMNSSARNAEWYYLCGVCLMRMGNTAQAEQMLDTAISMDPGNSEYINTRNRLGAVNGRFGYTNNSGTYNYRGGRGRNVSTCDICQCLICSDCCCESMGGDLIPCC